MATFGRVVGFLQHCLPALALLCMLKLQQFSEALKTDLKLKPPFCLKMLAFWNIEFRIRFAFRETQLNNHDALPGCQARANRGLANQAIYKCYLRNYKLPPGMKPCKFFLKLARPDYYSENMNIV